MHVRVLRVGKGRDRLLAELAGRYLERACRMAPVQLEHVPEAEGAGRSADEARRLEADRLRAALAGDGKAGRGGGRSGRGGDQAVVALDERGETLSSRELARLLEDLARRGVRRTTFVIGGDEGLDPGLVSGADRVLALSRMTFTHELACVVLLEQLYRAHALLAGHPYHRD